MSFLFNSPSVSNPPQQCQEAPASHSVVFLRSHFGGPSAQSARAWAPKMAPLRFLYLEKGARARGAAHLTRWCGALVFVVRIFLCVLCWCAALSAFFFSMCVSSSALPALCVGLKMHSRRIPSNVALECATLRECCLGEGISAKGADGSKSNEKSMERMDGDKRTPNSIQYPIIYYILKRVIPDLKAKDARHRIWLCVLARSLGGGGVNSQIYEIYKEFVRFAGDVLRVLVGCLRSLGVFLGALGVDPGSARGCSLAASRAANMKSLGNSKGWPTSGHLKSESIEKMLKIKFWTAL